MKQGSEANCIRTRRLVKHATVRSPGLEHSERVVGLELRRFAAGGGVEEGDTASRLCSAGQGVPDGAADQDIADPIAPAQGPVYPGTQSVPAEILLRQNRRVKFCPPPCSEAEGFQGGVHRVGVGCEVEATGWHHYAGARESTRERSRGTTPYGNVEMRAGISIDRRNLS